MTSHHIKTTRMTANAHIARSKATLKIIWLLLIQEFHLELNCIRYIAAAGINRIKKYHERVSARYMPAVINSRASIPVCFSPSLKKLLLVLGKSFPRSI
ncbi:MAG: hypothetical protein HGA22_11715 [Clostridiales bacterium]|nr:hypothetical protein [Clostridiales bacterium]